MGLGVAVKDEVTVAVGVFVGVEVLVKRGVRVPVGLFVGVEVGVKVGEAVGVRVKVAVGTGVPKVGRRTLGLDAGAAPAGATGAVWA